MGQLSRSTVEEFQTVASFWPGVDDFQYSPKLEQEM